MGPYNLLALFSLSFLPLNASIVIPNPVSLTFTAPYDDLSSGPSGTSSRIG